MHRAADDEIQPLTSTSVTPARQRLVQLSLQTVPPESPARFSDVSLIDPPRWTLQPHLPFGETVPNCHERIAATALADSAAVLTVQWLRFIYCLALTSALSFGGGGALPVPQSKCIGLLIAIAGQPRGLAIWNKAQSPQDA